MLNSDPSGHGDGTVAVVEAGEAVVDADMEGLELDFDEIEFYANTAGAGANAAANAAAEVGAFEGDAAMMAMKAPIRNPRRRPTARISIAAGNAPIATPTVNADSGKVASDLSGPSR